MDDRQIFDSYKKGKTPKELIDKGISKSKAYKVYERYNFIKNFLGTVDKLEDIVLSISKRNFEIIKIKNRN